MVMSDLDALPRCVGVLWLQLGYDWHHLGYNLLNVSYGV
jgi:hypothetical protein